MAKDKEIQALIQLLDDEDKEVYKHVYHKLKSFGVEAIPQLEEVWSAEINTVTHDRLEEIIREIHFDTLVIDWETWLEKDSPDLLSAAFLIARYHYPELKLETIQKALVKLRQSIWLELNYNQTPLEQVQIFNQVFYGYHQFTGVQTIDGFNDLCLNQVLETKKGNCIMIGLIYQIIANELNLPIYGVNLSRHFILCVCKRTILDFSLDANNAKEVMFYINPVNKGSIFSRNEIKDYLDKLHAEHEPKYFIPAGNYDIIKELLSYLIAFYTRQNMDTHLKDMNYLLQLMG